MCTASASACIRNTLVRAFRSPCRRASIYEFLAPSLSTECRRHFSSHKRLYAEPKAVPQSFQTESYPPDSTVFLYPPKPDPSFFSPEIPLPHHGARDNIHEWLTAMERYIPPRLRLKIPATSETTFSGASLDFSWLLIQAQVSSQDIISHVGLVEGRWDLVLWMVKKVIEDGERAQQPETHWETFENWPDMKGRPMKDLTNKPINLPRLPVSPNLGHSLDDITSAPESIEFRRVVTKKALGQVWRSLGNILLTATESHHNAGAQTMSHVLEIIALLHHTGLIPDSVYSHKSHNDPHGLQQPPTLHLLSSSILTALSDATWRAHEASVKAAKNPKDAKYFLGQEIPGSRYKVQVPEVAPELWLELVLWSCLHGGWISDGVAILEKLFREPSHRWRLISWQQLQSVSEDPSGWRLFGKGHDAASKYQDRTRVQRTISSELVTAFIDGLVNEMRVGVGARGTEPEDIVRHIQGLKQFLDVNSLSLGFATWDSIIVRLLESGGVVPEKRPELLLEIMKLSSGFGVEVASPNAPSRSTTEPPYFFEPSTTPISLLHRTMRSFLNNGGITGAMQTLKALQDFTDQNKQKSVEEFFLSLKRAPPKRDEAFPRPPIEFPAFDPQLPNPLLAKLLDLATEAKLYDFSRFLFSSEDLDGPLIGTQLYNDWRIAASLIRFGTLVGDNELVMKIVRNVSIWDNKTKTQQLPAMLLTVMLCAQIQLHRWQSVGKMQNFVLENPGYRPRAEILAHFAAEALRLHKNASEDSESSATVALQAFKSLLFAWESIVLRDLRNELYCILAILSSTDAGLKDFCSQFLAFSARQSINLSTDDFNKVLAGTLDGFGSAKGRDLVDMWCHRPPKTFEPFRASGGLPTMPRFRLEKGQELEDRPQDIMLTQTSGAKLILQGRINPNRQTIWAVLRKVQQEEADRLTSGEKMDHDVRVEMRMTLKWAARLLYYMGFDYEDIVQDLGSLAELAELEGPRALRMSGSEKVEQGP
ncbi:hypothetical protein B0J11DRAFT_41291 [Dendryphion nanum]|uniref:Uncharacterized protein n=1 Tax=Dendryphion nanum TaxID=256645 RepID=A0A9P9IZ92_9PLEO|nr:hypothetical protein B0J11DRAFT_41291 [Dendryphion nanum]